MRVIEAAGPLAWWRTPLAVAGFAALVMAAAFLTHVEKRYPLVYYKSRRFQARALAGYVKRCQGDRDRRLPQGLSRVKGFKLLRVSRLLLDQGVDPTHTHHDPAGLVGALAQAPCASRRCWRVCVLQA